MKEIGEMGSLGGRKIGEKNEEGEVRTSDK